MRKGFKRHTSTHNLTAITTLAKKIREKSPKKKWTTCIKEAAKQLKK
jgi:hypothetical protein